MRHPENHPPSTARALAARFLDGLLPPTCLLCGASADSHGLCRPCRTDLPRLAGGCRQCALPGPPPGRLCGACLRRPPGFRSAAAVLAYTYPVDRLVWQFKFRRQLAAGHLLAGELATGLAERITWRPDALVPVPLHFVRRAKRGFNQSELLAWRLGSVLEMPVDCGLLRRARATSAQSGLDLRSRRRNLRGAFRCGGAAGRRIALVDDVLTTGTTLNECARTLLKAGAVEVAAWVVARVPAPWQPRI
ncbi:ComF family protein [Elongatibacter sediminis]|uniref:ComF family protein n=1 Tax=Elongatibacter sediminis TaxID=3119006 RepID=A0AAW9REF2_9GAMM